MAKAKYWKQKYGKPAKKPWESGMVAGEEVPGMVLRAIKESQTALIHEDDLAAMQAELESLRAAANRTPSAPKPAAPGNCFECGETGDMHEHHVIPRSLGGRSTVTLCEGCHGKIHGLDFRDHGVLTRQALTNARRRGVRLGRAKGDTDAPVKVLARHPDIVTLVRAGKSLRDIAARTGKSQNTVLKVRRLLSPELHG